MYVNITVTFDNYAEFVRAMAPETLELLAKDHLTMATTPMEGPEPVVPEPVVPELHDLDVYAVPQDHNAGKPAALETPPTAEPVPDIADVRKLLAEISRKKGKEASKALIQAAGAERLTEVAPEKLAGLYAAAKEVAADAG